MNNYYYSEREIYKENVTEFTIDIKILDQLKDFSYVKKYISEWVGIQDDIVVIKVANFFRSAMKRYFYVNKIERKL